MRIEINLNGGQFETIVAALTGIASRLDRLADAWEGKKPEPAPIEEPILLEFSDADPAPESKPDRSLGWTADGKPRQRQKPGKVTKSGRVILKDYTSAGYVFYRTFGKDTAAKYHGEKTNLLLAAVRATGARTEVHKRHRFIHREDVQTVIDWMNAHLEQ